MAKFTVVSGFSLGNHVDVYPGDVIELPDNLARHYLQRQRVVPFVEETAEPVEEPVDVKGPARGKGKA